MKAGTAKARTVKAKARTIKANALPLKDKDKAKDKAKAKAGTLKAKATIIIINNMEQVKSLVYIHVTTKKLIFICHSQSTHFGTGVTMGKWEIHVNIYSANVKLSRRLCNVYENFTQI